VQALKSPWISQFNGQGRGRFVTRKSVGFVVTQWNIGEFHFNTNYFGSMASAGDPLGRGYAIAK
jgi:hypothetical protein